MEVKIKKLVSGAVLPKRATIGSAAYDLFVPTDMIVGKGRQIIPLGFAIEIPQGYEALIDARSGFSSKGMEGYAFLPKPDDGSGLINHTRSHHATRYDCDVIQGKIDSDYRGGVGVIINNRDVPFIIEKDTRIAQMTFHKVEDVEWHETDELSTTDRNGGFGHTGTK